MVKNKVKLLEAVSKCVGQPTPRPLPSHFLNITYFIEKRKRSMSRNL